MKREDRRWWWNPSAPCRICSRYSPCRTPRSSRKSDADPLIGTGPFRVTAWEPGRRLTLAAFDDYWGGRPYLDAVDDRVRRRTRARRPVRYPAWARPAHPSGRFKHVVVCAAHAGSHHSHKRRSGAGSGAGARYRSRTHRRMCSRSIREKRLSALLPQWLSGYEFLFQSAPDVTRAKQLVSQLRPGENAQPELPGERSVPAIRGRSRGFECPRRGDRSIQPTPGGNGNLRLMELPLESTDAAHELQRFAEQLGAADRARQLDPAKPETLYAARTISSG